MKLLKDSKGRSVVPIVIDNELVALDPSHAAPVINSVSGEPVHYFQFADVETCNKACDAAWAAFKTWKRSKVAERRDIILKAANLILERSSEFVAAQTLETSCTEDWGLFNVKTAVAYMKEIAACIGGIRGELPLLLSTSHCLSNSLTQSHRPHPTHGQA